MKLFFILLFILQSCASHIESYDYEGMLPDGKTWYTSVDDKYNCGRFFNNLEEIKSAESTSCLEQAKNNLKDRTFKICGKQPERVFGCKIRRGTQYKERSDLHLGHFQCYFICG